MPSAIPYLDETWNPIEGCTPCSPGCDRCWARAMDRRFSGGVHGPEWHPERLVQLARWRRPRRVGVVFTGDLWHPDVRWEWRARICLAMLAYHQHTYLFLTKRAETMRYETCVRPLTRGNFWHGVTVEDQPRAADRLPHLVLARVAHRWVSFEPLLGPVKNALLTNSHGESLVEWVVVGCESGPGARPCHMDWIEGIVDQCMAAQVPVYVKQVRVGRKIIHDPARFPAHLRLRQLPDGWE